MSSDIEILGETSALATKADKEMAEGNHSEARALYRRAAEIIECHLQHVSRDKEKTLSLFINNVVALWWKSGDVQKCSELALSLLGANPPKRVVPRLKEFTMLAWKAEELTSRGVTPSLVSATPIWMSLHPLGLPSGFAGSGDVANKLTALENLFLREAEYESVATIGLEPKYKTPAKIRDSVRLISSSIDSGSDSMCLWVQSEPMQPDWLNPEQVMVPSSEALVFSVTELLTAAGNHDAYAVGSIVPAIGFRNQFMRILIDLAPDGKSLEAVEVSGGAPDVTPIVLMPGLRTFAKEQIKRPAERKDLRLFTGLLKGVASKGDSLNLEVEEHDGTRQTSLYLSQDNEILGQIFDMWEKSVILLTKPHKQGLGYRYEVLSIEQAVS